MEEIEALRLQLALEQVIDSELDVGDSFCFEKRTSGSEQALVHVRAHNLAGGAGPLAEDAKPAQGTTTDIQGPFARSSAELREQLPAGGLPDKRLQAQAFQLGGLVGEQVVPPSHRPPSIS